MQEHFQLLKERAEAALRQLTERSEGVDQFADLVLNELRAALGESPGAGELLGPLMGQLLAVRKTRPDAGLVRWVGVGGGHLAIGHRPKLKTIPALRQHGATHIVTLLTEAEGAADIAAAVKKAGMSWLWLPLESAAPPPEERLADVSRLYEGLRTALASRARVYVHCSAGIHRTGMITHGLLRSMGLSQGEAMALLRSLRSETGEGVGEGRLQWGDQFSASG